MTLRLRGWKRRFLGLGACALVGLATGCNSDKQERRLPSSPMAINKPMGPGNTVMTPPSSPAFNNLTNNPPGIVTQPTTQPQPFPTTTTQNVPAPVMPSMPSMPPIGSRPQMNMPSAMVPANAGMNQANFNQPAAMPLPNPNMTNTNQNTRSAYPIQQNVPGMPGMQVQPVQMQANPQMTMQAPPMQQQMPMVQQPPMQGVQPHQFQPLPQTSQRVEVQQNTPQYNQQMQQPAPAPLPQQFQQQHYQQQPVAPQQPQMMPPQQLILPNYNQSMKPSDQMQGISAPGETPAAVRQASAQLMQRNDSTTGPSVKVIAQNIRGANDPSFRLPPDPVMEAPITVPTTNLGR